MAKKIVRIKIRNIYFPKILQWPGYFYLLIIWLGVVKAYALYKYQLSGFVDS